MNIQQLKYVREVARNGYSVSKAAATLHTSQPGISQQIRLLEEELGIGIFVRDRNRFSGVTPQGRIVVDRLNAALAELDYVQSYARSLRESTAESLRVITTHTQARYVLPRVLAAFAEKYPSIRVDVRHGTQVEVVQALTSQTDAIGLAPTLGMPLDKDLIALPVASNPRVVIVPPGHPLLALPKPTLQDVVRHPLITYESSVGSRQAILDTFERNGLEPQIILGATDADVMKACVASGLGIAVVPLVAFDEERDKPLRRLPVLDWFPPSTVAVLIHRKRALRRWEFDFVQLLDPTATPNGIEQLARGRPAASAAGKARR